MLAGKGVLLMERKEDHCLLVLFQVDGFYIEVKYHMADKKMLGLRSFSSTDALAPYMEKTAIPLFI